MGHAPFDIGAESSLKDQILKGKYHLRHRKWNSVTEKAKDLVRKLIVVDPSARLSAKEALAHPWFEVSIALISFACIETLLSIKIH